jgi:ketosteroid isomerase-like protein
MSQENVEVVRRVIEAFNRRDFDAALSHLAEDATWAPFLARTETSLLRGRSEIRAAWERQVEVMDVRGQALEVLADDKNRVVTQILMTARGRGSDLPIEGRFAAVATFHDGLVTSVESYADAAEALAAAGLSE